MKPIHQFLLAGIVGIFLPTAAHAAPVTWGLSWTAVTNNEAIQVLGGYTTVAGVNFNGSTTTINNGPGGTGGTNVVFTGIGNNTSGSAAGITVASSGMAFSSTGSGNSNVASAVGSPQTWTTVLDRVIGDDNNAASIDLTGLTIGSQYYVQFFSNTPDSNINGTTKITSGGVQSATFGSPHAGGATKYIIATFTADATSQSFAITGTEPTFSALVIGVNAGGDSTAPDWTATWPQVDPLSTTSLTVRAKTNEAGNAFYVVLPDGATAPTSAQVKAGTDSSNAPVSASGSLALTANTEATAPVGSLSPGTAYDVYFVAQDAVPNLQVSPVKVDASTLAPDVTPPTWTATWPQAAQLSPTSITVRAQTNETGTAYYVVLADGATAPSAAQVIAGTDGDDVVAIAVGDLALTANVEATGPVTGLTADTSYDVYFIAQDAVPNLQATPVLVNVSLVTPAVVSWGSWTAVTDETAIQTPGGYTYGGVNFNGSNTTINSLAFTGIAQNASGVTNGVTVGTTGFAFQSPGSGNSNVVSAVGSPTTWATVLDQVIGDDNNSASIDLTGLTPGTAYTVQFFSNTPDSNINGTTKITSGGVESATFGSPHAGGATKYIIASFIATSASQSFSITGVEPTFSALVIGVNAGGDSTAPDWTATWPQVNPLSSTSLTVRAKTNETGTAYYVVLPDGATAPTAAQVKLGQDSSSTPVSASGSLALTANTEATATVGSLSPSTSYDVYFVAQDAVPNLQASPVMVNASTPAPNFADWIAGYDVGGLTAFGDDADGDGLDNGLENFLGTAPNVGNAGLTAGIRSGNTFTFTHPQNATPASDVSAPVYNWSTDLVNWNASGASSGGITVTLAAVPNSPSPTTVTATVTVGTVPAKLFVRLGVSQN